MDVARKTCTFLKDVCRKNPAIISDLFVILKKKSQTAFICCWHFSLLEPSKPTCCSSSKGTILLFFWNDKLLKLSPNGLKETGELRPRTLETTADTFSVPVQCHALYPLCLCTWTLRHKQWIFLIEFVLFCLKWMAGPHMVQASINYPLGPGAHICICYISRPPRLFN